VSQVSPIPVSNASQLGVRTVLGLSDLPDGENARLRIGQSESLKRLPVMRFTGHLACGLMTVTMFSPSVPMSILAAWAVALLLALVNAARLDTSLCEGERRPLMRIEIVRHAIGVGFCSLLWGVALLEFPLFSGPTERYALWTLVAMLIAGSAANMSATPLSTIVFAAIAGVAAAASFGLAGEWPFAIAALTFVTVVTIACFETARTYISARIAEAGVVEKDEVVSLLLKEFEENEADWLWQIDTSRRVRAASPRFAYALGCDPEKIEGESLIRLIAGETWERGDFPRSLHDLAERLKRRESFSNLLVQVHLADGRRWWELSGTPMRDENGSFIGFRGVGSDVTEQRDRDDKIAYLARYDTLTGLPNRLMLTEALGEALRYADQWKSRCAFLMIDLDRFKQVNDSLGHQVGDRLLAQVSHRLMQVMTENEQCGRLGGDEFAVVIRDASDSGQVEKVANAIIEALSRPYLVDNHTLYIGASVGSALGPRDGSSVETLMRNADLALYKAKDEGGNTHFAYLPALHADAEERRKLELSLRAAIGKEELQLHFQPVVDARSEAVLSFEALLRWNSSEHGFVSPGKFIPLAEDTRLIVPIGNWVLHEACREAVRWPSHIKVAVNVSGEQLLEPGFSNTVVRALADTGLPAGRLEVEVTESVFLRDGRTARQTLEEIMALGCTIALDDFGTGYSSLGYLRTLRFSTIKVDRSFVQGAAQGSRESLAIINAVVAMAKSMEMTTTAEGVEDEAQAQMICQLGCTKIQGFYFGRPMEAREARALLAKPQAA
jgi:diguanylate cyclase (GGDEF)-like protein/PAS domain S-box-containing protein